MKKKLETIPVNLQQGFFLSDGSIIAAYSHHTKTVTIGMPWTLADLDIPANYKEYSIKYADGFHIEYWDSKQHKNVSA